ncbi:MAG TPA: YbaB/EbfC family nucleoid-associated protein [Nocardioidaceae bacterium]|nr:YbaB/EbfC family nucleoid-associated protein [Nocardioidaceae bacterium]
MTESGMPDMSALLAQAQRMQEQLLAAQNELASAVVEGSAASGLVTARVDGTGDLIGLDIKPEAVDPDDTETLADMIVAAVRDAKANAEGLARERLGDVTGGFGTGDVPGLPGPSDVPGGLPGIPGTPRPPDSPSGPVGFGGS